MVAIDKEILRVGVAVSKEIAMIKGLSENREYAQNTQNENISLTLRLSRSENKSSLPLLHIFFNNFTNRTITYPLDD